MTREITGGHVFAGFAAAFGLIVAVNLTLAYQAVHTFPGLEVRNSYVASQSFNADREAQEALGWDVTANVVGDELHLIIMKNGLAISPAIESAVFGRATSVAADQTPDFHFDGDRLVSPVEAGAGNWNLRLKARAADGTLFQQRIIVHVTR